VAVFIDIRGFSNFAEQNDSPAVAKYLRSFVLATLEKYFQNPSFFKLTGDGLLLIYEHADTELALRETVNLALRRAILLVQNFDHIAADDVMVNITGRLPNSLGVGIARGSATCITSGQVVLDYTGRCLNLAARVMDKARPLGLVFADRHADRLVDPDLDQLLEHDGICIRGISDQEPLPIRLTREVTIKPKLRP
jgi:class 3 adenylate cyclase